RVQYLVQREHRKVPGHELDDRPEPILSSAYADGRESQLRNRRIDDTLGTKLIQHTLAYLVGAVVFSNLLPHQENPVIATHFIIHSFAQRLSESNLSHYLLI